MGMLIICESCTSRFRFNEGLLKGAKGALVKCPRCGERILVRNPATPRVMPPVAPPPMPRDTPPIVHRSTPPVAPPFPPPVLPREPTSQAMPHAVGAKPPPVREEVPGGTIPLPPPQRPAFGVDLSAMCGSGPGHALSEGITFFPAADPGSVSPEIPGRQAQRVADLFRSPSEENADRDLPAEDDSSMEDQEAGPARRIPPPRPLYRRPLFVAAALFVLLLSGGATYYVDHVDGNSGWKPSGKMLPVQARSVSGPSVFYVQSQKGYLNKLVSGERLYVIKGTVTNVGRTAINGIRIRATLLGTDNQSIMESDTFAGNLIDDSLIAHMNRVRIEGFLGMRYGEGNVNRDIPVGMSLPFMVVFFDPPEGIHSFTVKAMDVDEAERTKSSDMEKTGTRMSREQSIRLN